MADIALNPTTLVTNGALVGTTNPLPVSTTSGAGGAITWTKTAITANGASQTWLAANTSRKGFIIASSAVNAAAAVDITGGTAALTAGIPIAGGGSVVFTGGDCPLGIITGIGTNTNIMTVYEGV